MLTLILIVSIIVFETDCVKGLQTVNSDTIKFQTYPPWDTQTSHETFCHINSNFLSTFTFMTNDKILKLKLNYSSNETQMKGNGKCFRISDSNKFKDLLEYQSQFFDYNAYIQSLTYEIGPKTQWEQFETDNKMPEYIQEINDPADQLCIFENSSMIPRYKFYQCYDQYHRPYNCDQQFYNYNQIHEREYILNRKVYYLSSLDSCNVASLKKLITHYGPVYVRYGVYFKQNRIDEKRLIQIGEFMDMFIIGWNESGFITVEYQLNQSNNTNEYIEIMKKNGNLPFQGFVKVLHEYDSDINNSNIEERKYDYLLFHGCGFFSVLGITLISIIFFCCFICECCCCSQQSDWQNKISKSIQTSSSSYSQQQDSSSSSQPSQSYSPKINPQKLSPKERHDQTPKFKDSNQGLADILLNDVLDLDHTLKWEQIAGLQNAKLFLQEAIMLPVRFPSKIVGEQENLVHILFRMARHYALSVIFIDEIDSIASQRGSNSEREASRKKKGEILIQIDVAISRAQQSADKSVIVIAATNFPWDLDQRILRRFEKRIYIPMPNTEARSELLKINFKEIILADDVKLDAFAEQMEGYSGSDITNVCRDASMMNIRNKLKKMKNSIDFNSLSEQDFDNPITSYDMQNALVKVKTSVNNTMIKKFEDWRLQFGSE